MEPGEFCSIPKGSIVGVDFALRQGPGTDHMLYPLVLPGQLCLGELVWSDITGFAPAFDPGSNGVRGRRETEVHIDLGPTTDAHAIANANGAVHRLTRVDEIIDEPGFHRTWDDKGSSLQQQYTLPVLA